MQHTILLATLLVFLNSVSLFAQKKQELVADSLSTLEQYEKAIPLYEKVLKETEDLKDFLRISTNLAISHQRNRNDKASIPILEAAIEKVGDQVVNDSLLGLAYHKLAVGHYKAFDDDEKAIEYWQKAIAIREKIFPPNHISIIKGYRNIGSSLYYLDRLEESTSFLEKSLDLHLSKIEKDTALLGNTYNDLSEIALVQEDFEKAENYLKVTKSISEKLYQDEPWNLAPAYEKYFDLKMRTNDIEGMQYYANRVLSIYEGFEDLYDDDKWLIANAYNNLALAYDLAKNREQAKIQYLKSIEINKQFPEKRQGNLVIGLSNLALVYKGLGQFDKAIETFKESIAISIKNGNQRKEAIDKNNLAEIYALQGKKDLALKTSQEAIDLGISIKIDKPVFVESLHSRILILQGIYQTTKNADYLNKAIGLVNQTLPLFDEIRQGYQSDESKSFLSKKSKIILNTAIQLHADAFDLTKDETHLYEAFTLAERAKSLILLDALNETQAKKTTGIPKKLSTRENRIKKEIAAIDKQIFDGAEDVSQLQSEQLILNRELEKLKDTLETNFPKYFDAKYAKTTFDTKVFQQTLKGTLVEYVVSDSMIYAFVLSAEQIDLVQLPIDFPLKSTIQTLRQSIYSGFLNSSRSDSATQQTATTYCETAHLLYQKLILPISEKVDISEVLTIIPDDLLGYIPFDILLTNPVKESMLFGIHPYLIKKHQISYCYSAQLLQEMQQKKGEASQLFTAFAPVFKSDDTTKTDQRIAAVRAGLSPLDYNIPEVEALRDLIGGTVYTGLTATRVQFNEHGPQHRIIHLATHGKANDEIGDYAYLAFTENQDTLQSSKLYNRDLYNLQLNADMVVLSACETGIGELQKGEGIISLARGFSYAGAKSIITTLWSINDEKTKELMLQFYQNLQKGQSKDQALRQAKLDFIAQYSHTAHPFFWAAFIPIGDMKAIAFDNRFKWYIFGMLTFLIAGLIIFLLKREKV